MFWLRRPSPDDLQALLDRARSEPFSYADVGATAAAMPPGYRHDRWSADLGDHDFDAAADALLHWRPQLGAGLVVFPEAPASQGATFVLVIPLGGPLHATAAGRVVYVIDEEDRRGFAYGTLESHPEEGEEALVVVRESGRVRFEISAFSRPRHPLARTGFLFTRWLQLRVNRAYLAAMRRS